MIARIVTDQRRKAVRAAAAANKPELSNQRTRRQARQRIGVKNIEGRIRGRSFKIKKGSSSTKEYWCQKNGIVVRKMVVRRRTIFPAEVKRAYY